MTVKNLICYGVAIWLIIKNCNTDYALNNNLKLDLEKSTFSPTICYANASLVVVCTNSTSYTESSVKNGKTTEAPQPVSSTTTSEVATGVSSQSKGFVASFDNVSVAATSKKTQLPDHGDHVRIQGSSSSTTNGYNNSLLVVAEEEPTQYTESKNCDGKTTDSTQTVSSTTISEVVTGMASQPNPTNVVATSKETRLLKHGDTVKKQGTSSSATTGYSNASLVAFDTDSTWHTQSNNSNGKTTDTAQRNVSTIVPEIVIGVLSQQNKTLDGLADVGSIGNKSVAAISEGTKHLNSGEQDKDPVKPSIAVTIIICIFILIGGMVYIYIRNRMREGVSITIREY